MAKLLLTNKLRKRADRLPWLMRGLVTLEGLILGGLLRFSGLLSPDRASASGRWLLRAVGPRLQKTWLIRRNLELAFPEKNPDEIEQLVREVWGSYGAVVAEYPHLGTICRREADQRLQTIISKEVVLQHDRPAVFVAPHLSNWEVTAAAVARQGIPLTALYTEVANPALARLLDDARKPLGYELISRDGSARTLIKRLAAGGSIALATDMRVDTGEPIPFFGREMMTSITPAQLALRFDCDLIPVQLERLDGKAVFRVTLHPPVRPDNDGADRHEKARQMTTRVNALFEDWIRENPGEWACSKRRWDKRLYREYRP